MLFPLKLALLAIGALYIFVAYNDWKRIYPFMLRIFGKKIASSKSKSVSRFLMYSVGGVFVLFSLWWIF